MSGKRRFSILRALRGFAEGWRSGTGPARFLSRGQAVTCPHCSGELFTRAARYSAPVSGWMLGGEWPLVCSSCGHVEKVLDPKQSEPA